MLAICLLPFVLVALATDHSMSVTVAGSRDSGIRFDYGVALAETPGILAAALLAPFVGYRRWVALWFSVPFVNLYFAWIMGVRAVELGARLTLKATPQTPHGDDTGSEIPAPRQSAEDLIRQGLKR